VERRLEEGDAATAVLRVAQETSSDLIVMGTRGRTGQANSVMGSVAEYVVRKATCPVVTIAAPLPDAGPPPKALPEELRNGSGVDDYWIDLGAEG
jgi:hypothetical protein